MKSAKPHTLESFIEVSTQRHGNTYDYSVTTWDSKNVTIKCPTHGLFQQRPHNHMRGAGCPVCWKERRGKSRIPKWEDVKSKLTALHPSLNFDSFKHVDSKTKSFVECKLHGVFETSVNALLSGHGCPTCGMLKSVSAKTRPSTDVLCALTEKHPTYTFPSFSSEYRTTTSQITVLCPEHGKFTARPHKLLKGQGCPECGLRRGARARTWSRDGIIELAEIVHDKKYDYSLLVYTGLKGKITIICPDHGPFEQEASSHIYQQAGCPSCSKTGPSKQQLELSTFLSTYTQVIIDYKYGSTSREVDLFLPEFNLAVEYHGLIWHSTRFNRDPRHTFKKSCELKEIGLSPVTIFEDEWLEHKTAVKNMLLSKIGALPKIHARKCTVREITQSDAVQFLDTYHMQGSVSGCSQLGLYHGQDLVALMSVSTPSSIRGERGETTIELRRYAATCCVIGGASRLLAATLRRHPHVQTVVSYSDNRLFSGAMYEKLGFTIAHTTPPDYSYTKGDRKRIHKSQFQRRFLASKLDTFDPVLSESENCAANGWFQVYDCGKTRWDLHVQQKPRP